MVISHRYKFIFVKTKKTAGTSIEVYLSRLCGREDILTPIHPPVIGHEPRNYRGGGGFYNHMSACKIKNAVGAEVFNSYYKFCVERNPFEKVISFYWMKKAEEPGLTINEFLMQNDIGYNWPIYTDSAQSFPIVNKVLRYETLQSDLSAVFNILGVPWHGDLGVRAKAEYRKDHRPWQEVLTNNQIDFIKKIFYKEFQFHGY